MNNGQQRPPPPPGRQTAAAMIGDHQPHIVDGRAARGVVDDGDVNAAHAAPPRAHQPNIQARGAPVVDIHQPMAPEVVSESALEFLSSMPDVSRSSVAELGLPAYRWPSVK